MSPGLRGYAFLVPFWLWIASAAGVFLFFGLLLVGLRRFGRRARFRAEFGSEYDYAVRRSASRKEAEDELRRRRELRTRAQLRPLEPANRGRYEALWGRAQESFVDDPEAAVHEAERLIREVMTLRGYPSGDFDQRAADLALESPDLAAEYRAAREMARAGHEDTEALRKAMRHYRTLFHQLVGVDEGETVSVG